MNLDYHWLFMPISIEKNHSTTMCRNVQPYLAAGLWAIYYCYVNNRKCALVHNMLSHQYSALNDINNSLSFHMFLNLTMSYITNQNWCLWARGNELNSVSSFYLFLRMQESQYEDRIAKALWGEDLIPGLQGECKLSEARVTTIIHTRQENHSGPLSIFSFPCLLLFFLSSSKEYMWRDIIIG